MLSCGGNTRETDSLRIGAVGQDVVLRSVHTVFDCQHRATYNIIVLPCSVLNRSGDTHR